MEVCNELIRSTTLGVEDHGIFSSYVSVDFEGSSQGFGGYVLDGVPIPTGSGRQPNVMLAQWVQRICELYGKDWEKLPGTPVRILKTDEFNSKILAIGNFIKDRWVFFDVDDEAFVIGSRNEAESSHTSAVSAV